MANHDFGAREELRRCPHCQELRRFVDLRCRVCGHKNLDETPPIYSERCLRCKRLVAATTGGLCGLCAARAEYDHRKKTGTLTKPDRTERMYAKVGVNQL